MRTLLIAACATCLAALPGGAQNRAVDAHPPGYIPVTVPATTRIVVNRVDLLDLRRGLDIYVTPNLVSEAEALSYAAYRAAAYCNSAYGSSRIKLTRRARHSEVSLDSWAFRGFCRR